MSKGDRQKIGILAVLLAVFGITAVLGYRMMAPPTTTTAQTPEPQQKPSTSLPATVDGRIRLDLLENQSGDDIGKRNLFQYRQAPPPPPPSSQARGGSALAQTAPPPVTTAPPPPRPTGPPPPPPIPLKFQGFAVTENPSRGLTAFIADDARHYNVTAGEVLMGRYRIVSISDKSVEVEDLQFNRRQTLPLLK